MTNFAVMLDYGSQAYDGDIEEFYESFLASHVSCQFEKGNPQYIAGLSGIELAETVFVYQKVNAHEVDYLPDSCSDVYWAGWALAYFQWVSNFSFSFIQRSGLTLKRVLQMYRTFHEADISKFVEAAYEIIDKARKMKVFGNIPDADKFSKEIYKVNNRGYFLVTTVIFKENGFSFFMSRDG